MSSTVSDEPPSPVPSKNVKQHVAFSIRKSLSLLLFCKILFCVYHESSPFATWLTQIPIVYWLLSTKPLDTCKVLEGTLLYTIRLLYNCNMQCYQLNRSDISHLVPTQRAGPFSLSCRCLFTSMLCFSSSTMSSYSPFTISSSGSTSFKINGFAFASLLGSDVHFNI